MKFTQEHCDLYGENEWLKKVIAEKSVEIERLTKKAEEAKFWENEYLEWTTGFLKTRFDIKDWFTNPETQRTPCTYEFFASTLWEKIRPAMEWLDELKERNEKLRRENIELQKQVDKAWWEVGKMCMEERKTTAKEILIDFNEWINGQYDAKLDTYSVHIPVHEVNDFLTDKAKEYGVEVD